MIKEPILSISELADYVREVFPQANIYDLNIVELCKGAIKVEMGAKQADLRPGGTISGPTMFALADISAYMLVLAHIGKVPLAVTTNLNINFVNKPKSPKIHAKTSLLKLGKRLAVCDIHIYTGEMEELFTLVAHATATYSIPEKK